VRHTDGPLTVFEGAGLSAPPLQLHLDPSLSWKNSFRLPHKIVVPTEVELRFTEPAIDLYGTIGSHEAL
jgi:hypothetical protein